MRKSAYIIAMLLSALMVVLPNTAQAQCSNPSASAGTMLYNEDESVPQYCDDTNWIAMAPLGGVDIDAVNFNGSDLRRSSEMAGLEDSNKFTMSFWFKNNSAGFATEVLYENDDPSMIVYFNTPDNIRVSCQNEADAIVFQMDTDRTFPDTEWHHVVFSFDLSSTSRRHVYIDGQIDYPNYGFYVDDDCDFATTDPAHWVMTNLGSFVDYDGDIAEFWMDFGTYINLDDQTNLAKKSRSECCSENKEHNVNPSFTNH